jgi:two-component system, chemotaxis family, chemotaxis protein CheY
MKIMVVEDSPSMRAYVTTAVEELPVGSEIDIIEAGSGFEALKLLPHHQLDVILTDINMPDINGLELVSFIKNHPTYKSIPILVISTESSEEDRRRAEALGAEGYLVKPFEQEELLDKLKSLLKLS